MELLLPQGSVLQIDAESTVLGEFERVELEGGGEHFGKTFPVLFAWPGVTLKAFIDEVLCYAVTEPFPSIPGRTTREWMEMFGFSPTNAKQSGAKLD